MSSGQWGRLLTAIFMLALAAPVALCQMEEREGTPHNSPYNIGYSVDRNNRLSVDLVVTNFGRVVPEILEDDPPDANVVPGVFVPDAMIQFSCNIPTNREGSVVFKRSNDRVQAWRAAGPYWWYGFVPVFPPDGNEVSFQLPEQAAYLATVGAGMLLVDDKESESAKDTTLSLEYYQNDQLLTEDRVSITILRVDLDVDSDNNDDYAPPASTPEEDAIEEDEPGKTIRPNDLDVDNDGVPDWADGFDADPFDDADDVLEGDIHFVPMRIRLGPGIDPAKAKVRFYYDAADPSWTLHYDEDGNTEYFCPGGLRIWLKDAGEARDPLDAQDGGDFVGAIAYPGSYQYNPPEWQDNLIPVASLFPDGEAQSEVVVYLEGCYAGTYQIIMEVDGDGDAGPMDYILSDRVTVTVLPRPIAYADTYTVPHDTTSYFAGVRGLLGNDANVSDDVGLERMRNIVLLDANGEVGKELTTAANGSVRVDDTGSLLYTPPEAWIGSDGFQYKVGNGDFYSAPGTVTINVTNVPPAAANDSYIAVHGRTLRIPASTGVLANDVDARDKVRLRAVLVDEPSHGTVTLHASGAFLYKPGVGAGGYEFVGQDTFTYRASDGIEESATACVQVDVRNAAAIGVADSYSIPIGTKRLRVSAQDGVLKNDADGDKDTLRAVLAEEPSKGTVALQPSGAFLYSVTTPFSDADTFTYRVSDGAGAGSPVTVTIQATQGVAMSLHDDVYSITHGRALAVGIDAGVLSNDTLPGDTADLTLEVVGGSASGVTLHNSGIFTYQAGNTLGPVSFSYRVTHSAGVSDEALVTINVVNAKPEVHDAAYSVPLGRVLVIDRDLGVGAYAADADGDRITFTAGNGQVVDGDAADGPGQLFMKPSGAFVYTPPTATFRGTVTFAYSATDGVESSAPATVRIEVEAPESVIPTACNRIYTVLQRSQLVVGSEAGLLAGAVGKGRGPLSVTVTNAASMAGSLTYRPGGSFRYVPPLGLTGEGDLDLADEAQFIVRDSMGDSSPATLSIRVINKAPVGGEDTYEVEMNDRLVVSHRSGLLANDSDEEGDPLSAIVVNSPINGELRFVGQSGAFIYEPDEGFVGTDYFTYCPTDGLRRGFLTFVTVNVRSAAPPTAADDSYRVLHRSANRVLTGAGKRYELSATRSIVEAEDALIVSPWKGVLQNDGDPDGRALSATLADGPTNGTLDSFDASGSFVYVPDEEFVGSDSFTYCVSNGKSVSSIATVHIEVVNTAPHAVPDSYQVRPNDTLVVSLRTGLLANDRDGENDPITAELLQGPTHGTLSLGEQGAFVYTPTSGFSGTDTFTYRAGDGLLCSQSVGVAIAVTETPAPHAPVALGDEYSIVHDSTLSVRTRAEGILDNDYTFNEGGLAAEVVTDVAQGTLTLSYDGSFTYEPDAGYVGTDSFTYRARDAYGVSSSVTVAIAVTNAAPVATAQTREVHCGDTLDVHWLDGVVATARDADGDELSATLVTGVDAAHGALTFQEDGSYSFTPASNFKGTASFTYSVSDGITSSGIAAVNVDVTNSAPLSCSDSYVVHHDQPLVVQADAGLLANDKDADGDTLTVNVPTVTGLTVWSNGAFVYEPATGFSGQVTFNYTISDGVDTSEPATVTLSVTNDAPVASEDPSDTTRYQVRHDKVLVVASEEGILANDTSPDGDRICWTGVTQPAHGSLQLKENGSFIYTPTANGPVDDSFTYRLTDGISTTEPVTVHLRILYDAPHAEDDPVDAENRVSYRVVRNGQLIVDADNGLLANDSNPEGVLLALTHTNPSHGTVELKQNGAFAYTPTAGYAGSDGFSYTISDGITQSTASVSVHVTGQALAAADDSYDVLQDWVYVLTPDEESAGRWPTTGLIGSLGDNDSVPPDAKPQFVLVAGARHGQLHLGAHGGFVYQPEAGYASNPQDQEYFTYKIVTPYGESNIARVDLNVGTAALDAEPLELTASRNATITRMLPQDVNPPAAPGDAGPVYRATASISTAPQHGQAIITADGQLRYTPNDSYVGDDSFAYRWCLNGLYGAPATVAVMVTSTAPSVASISGDPEINVVFSAAYPPPLKPGHTPPGPYVSGFALTDLAIDEDFDDANGAEIGVKLVEGANDQWQEVSSIQLDDLGTVSIDSSKHLKFIPSPTLSFKASTIRSCVFHFRLTDSAGDGAVATARMDVYAPMYFFSDYFGQMNPTDMGQVPGDTDGFLARVLDAQLTAEVARHRAERVLSWERFGSFETRVVAEFSAAADRATSLSSAAQELRAAVRPKLMTLGSALVNADATRFGAEFDATMAEAAAARAAEYVEWKQVAEAAAAYAEAVNAARLDEEEAETTAMIAEVSAGNAAQMQSETASAQLQQALLQNLKTIGIQQANARAATDAQSRTESATLEAGYRASVRAAEHDRSVALKNARAALRTAAQQTAAALQAEVATASGTYESALAAAQVDRDDAIAAAAAALDTAIADAAATYAAGTQDQGVTAALTLGDDTSYLAAAASLHASYDSAVEAASAAYDSAAATARAAFYAAVRSAREDAADAVMAADAAFRSAEEDAHARYVLDVDDAMHAHDTAASAASDALVSGLAAAESAYALELDSANGNVEAASRQAEQELLNSAESAARDFDAALATALDALESQLTPVDSAYYAARLAHRNTYDADSVAALAAFEQSRADVDAGYRQSHTTAQDAWESAVFGATSTLDAQLDSLSTAYSNAESAAEDAKDTALNVAEAAFREATESAARHAQIDEENPAFQAYASAVQHLDKTLSDALGVKFLRAVSLWLDPTNEAAKTAVQNAVTARVRAELQYQMAGADANINAANTIDQARDVRLTACNQAFTTHYNDKALAEKNFQRARAEAEKTCAEARATADEAFFTVDATALSARATGIASATETWRRSLGEVSATWVSASAQDSYDHTVGQTNARTQHSAAIATAVRAQAATLIQAQSGLSSALQAARSDWSTANDIASGAYANQRAQKFALFSTELNACETAFDNAMATASGGLCIGIAQAGSARAAGHAGALSDYLGDVTTAALAFRSALLSEAMTFSRAESDAYAALVEDVQDERAAAVLAWKTVEGTNWATCVYSTSVAQRAFALAQHSACSDWIDAQDGAGQTFANATLASAADAAVDIAAENSTATQTSSSAVMACEQLVKQAGLDLTVGIGTSRAAYLAELAQQGIDAEAATIAYVQTHNQSLNSVHTAFSNAIVSAGADLQDALADAQEAFTLAEGGCRTTLVIATASAGNTSGAAIAQAGQTLSTAEADAFATHSATVWTAWATEQNGVAGSAAQCAKAYAAASETYNKAMADAAFAEASDLGPQSATFATAANTAEKNFSGIEWEQQRLRLFNWLAEVVDPSAGLPARSWNDFETYYPLNEAAEKCLDPSTWRKHVRETVSSYLPIYGSGREAFRCFMKGEYGWAVLHTVMAVSDVFLVKAMVTGIAKAAGKGMMRAGYQFVKCDMLKLGCFPAGTSVWTRDGPRPIETIQPGDEVWSYDHAAGEWVLAKVEERLERIVDTTFATITLELPDGTRTQVTATGNHPFWVESGERLDYRPRPIADAGLDDGYYASSSGGRYIEAQHLRAGDQLLAQGIRDAIVVAVNFRAECLTVHNLTVAGMHSYAVGDFGILAHNACYQEFRTFASLKRAMGPAGLKKVWHHVVEKCQHEVYGRFTGTAVHNTKNVVIIDATVNRALNGLYSSVRRDITGSAVLTVRQWLRTQSYEQCRRFGLMALRNVTRGVWP